MRPHGRDSTDVDVAPIVGNIVKKSFWLNKNLVSEVLRAVSANEAQWGALIIEAQPAPIVMNRSTGSVQPPTSPLD